MIFFSVGLPGRFGEWCDAVTAGLVEQALGPAEVIGADTIDQFALATIKAVASNVVIASRAITGGLWTALAQANRPFLVAIDDPGRALEDLITYHDNELIEATRLLAKSYASAVSCALIPGVLGLRADQAKGDPIATATAIARHFNLGVCEHDVIEIVTTLANSGISPGRIEEDIELGSPRNYFEEPQRVVLAGATDSYVAFFAGSGFEAITWERELFFINEEQPNDRRQPASRPVDITGRPRPIISGPDITLPQGSWSATVALGFSEGAAELSYMVDVYAGTQLAQARIQPAGQRFVEVNLDFSIPEPHVITLRICNERAAFDGRLALGYVTVVPYGHVRPETRRYFAAALTE
jgi:hypothetical protein